MIQIAAKDYLAVLFISFPIHATLGPIVKARMIVPIVIFPPARSPIRIMRKSQPILTAKNGRCEYWLIMEGMESAGVSPRSAFIYNAAEMRKRTSAIANVIDLYGCVWNISAGRNLFSSMVQKSDVYPTKDMFAIVPSPMSFLPHIS